MLKKQALIFFMVFGSLAIYLIWLNAMSGALVMLAIIALGVLVLVFPVAHFSARTESMLSYPEEESTNEDCNEDSTEIKNDQLIYYGSELNFEEQEIELILHKHLPYFKKLDIKNQEKFIKRLYKFLKSKTFHIHDESGFKEMPILISATAVQLSFGLDHYLLPNFENIHIYPQEFVGIHSNFRILEGNVSNFCINLSWKHFLKGFQLPDDGQNVGLHEFAHAYYFQFFETGESVDKKFAASYPEFDALGNAVIVHEKWPGNNLYSDYGLSNLQEFWAESVELFFEKPVSLKSRYPDLFSALIKIWNQDTSTL